MLTVLEIAGKSGVSPQYFGTRRASVCSACNSQNGYKAYEQFPSAETGINNVEGRGKSKKIMAKQSKWFLVGGVVAALVVGAPKCALLIVGIMLLLCPLAM